MVVPLQKRWGNMYPSQKRKNLSNSQKNRKGKASVTLHQYIVVKFALHLNQTFSKRDDWGNIECGIYPSSQKGPDRFTSLNLSLVAVDKRSLKEHLKD